MQYSNEVIEALAELRHRAHGHVGLSSAAVRLFNVLDNAGVFAALDEQTGYASALDILAESARKASAEDRFNFEHGRPAGDRLISQHGEDLTDAYSPQDPAPDEPLYGAAADRVRDELDASDRRAMRSLARKALGLDARPARTPRDDVAPHEHVYTDGRPEELCLYGSCTLTYAEYTARRT